MWGMQHFLMLAIAARITRDFQSSIQPGLISVKFAWAVPADASPVS
jgi:hypothetical protein